MPAFRLPGWLRRGLEAGLFAGLLSLLTVIAYRWDAGAAVGMAALPVGLTGSIVLALPILAVGVFTVAAGERVAILGGAHVLPVGFLAGLLAMPVAVGGIAASQLFSPHGFGRRAGRIGAIAAVIVATPILLVGVPLLA